MYSTCIAVQLLTSHHVSMQIKAFYNAVSAMSLKEGVRSMLQVSLLPPVSLNITYMYVHVHVYSCTHIY